MLIPTSLRATFNLFADYAHSFAICGGWAIDLYLNRITRDHNDIDITIERRHQHHLHAYMSQCGWSLDIAHHGQLTPWHLGDWIELPHHAIWCRHPTHQPDFVEFLLNEMDDHTYRFRRDLTITRPRHQAFIVSAVGIPILAPELALLYKATQPDRNYNTRDFLTCLPALDTERRTWLKTALTQLDNQHQWLNHL